MTDRYLFRGKREKDEQWEYGAFWQSNSSIIDKSGYSQKVMPNTVGQYIGRSDKNKKKIFEGDILLTDCWHTLLVVYFDEDYLQFRVREVVSGRENSIDYYDNSNNVKIEVVGNIYDNPELLEVQR